MTHIIDIAESIKGKERSDNLTAIVRDFLIRLHKGDRDLTPSLKALNSAMLFIDGRDYIEHGPKSN